MRVRRFVGKKIYGYLDVDVDFNDDITFLIGINGSGKTTVVRTINALVAPSIVILAHTAFDEVSVELDQEGKKITITCGRHRDAIVLRTSASAATLSIPAFVMPPGEAAYREHELALEYYRTQEATHAEHSVIQTLRKLPTPMFLGLERRVSWDRVASPRVRTATRYRRNVFGGTLVESLDEASDLASVRLRLIQEEDDKLKDDLRNALILRAFQYVDINPFNEKIKFPPKQERVAISKQREIVQQILLSIGFSETEMRKVAPFFDGLQKLLDELPTDFDPAVTKNVSERHARAVFNWALNKWQYDRVATLAKDVEGFTAASRELYRPIQQYLDTINSFLSESGKSIEINRFELRVNIPNAGSRSIGALSSGEQQLVVLLTHLAFNPAAERANVLIIDEPELSLHVSWQEKFADALLRSNPNIQFILATHSPSIILDRVDRCKELPRNG